MKVKLRRSLALLIAVLQILTIYTPIVYANDFDGQVVEQVVEQLEHEIQENGQQELEQQVFEQENFIQQEISQEPQFTYGPYSGGVDGKKHAYEPFAEDKADSLVVAENAPTGSYATDHVNVKLKDTAVDGTMMASVPTFSEYGISKIEPIFKIVEGSRSLMSQDSEAKDELLRWHTAVLSDDMDPKETVKMLLEDPYVETAELDYIRKIDSTTPTEITDPKMSDQWCLGNTKINEAWAHLEAQGINPGGSRDVVVAVIDTGVDSTHPDLTGNMWVNTGEVPGNNRDDDGNGFIDDINGASTVGNSWEGESGISLDDHGHGTHVAGIIAASANDGGMTGIAYNTQIMSIKAAQSSGVLTSSDIVEAIYYAVDKGADVINMSFGGYGQNQLEEDALAVAFGQAVLVAAAGNDSSPNVPYPIIGKDMFPAAYPWVLGVMAEDQYPASNGDYIASFSNWDYIAQDSHEYELMAPGVDIVSTLPDGKYAKWDGTSMAAPIVSGIAALLRSKFADVNSYSSRFIMGQLASTGDVKQGKTYSINKDPLFYNSVNAISALTDTPEPNLSYLEHYIFDSETLAPNNNDDGVVDAGEVLDLALIIRNHWGKADNVQVTIDTKSPGGMDDPYITIINDTVNYGAVGNFGTDDNGLIIENDVVVGVENAFKIKIADNTPNDHLVPINITLTCSNGFDPDDTTVYTFNSGFSFLVRRGTVVPNVISEDMTLTNDKYWIIPNATLVKEGATLTVDPGTQIQFWSSEPEGPYSEKAMAYLKVDGNLNVNGTAENPVEMFTSGFFEGYEIKIQGYENNAKLNYVKIFNPNIWVSEVDHCYFTQELNSVLYKRELSGGVVQTNSNYGPSVFGSSISNSIFYKLGNYYPYSQTISDYQMLSVGGIIKNNLFDSCILNFDDLLLEDSVYLNNYKLYGQQNGDRNYYVSKAMSFGFSGNENNILLGSRPIKNNENGSTYFMVSNTVPSISKYGEMLLVEDYAESMGGHIVSINDEAENQFLTNIINDHHIYSARIGFNDFKIEGQFEWINGENGDYSNLHDSLQGEGDNVVLLGNGQWSIYNQLSADNPSYIIEIPGAIDTHSIILNHHDLTLGAGGGTYSLIASFIPENATNKNIKWTSSNLDVAYIDENGTITPLAIGSTIIIATSEDGGFSDSCNITVVEKIPAIGIELNKKETNLYIGDTETINALVLPIETTEKRVIWESENSEIASVNSNGVVLGNNIGTTVVTAKTVDGNFIESCIVHVLKPVDGISLNQNFIRLITGSTTPTSIIATINPNDATNKNIDWMSTNTSVVEVDNSGNLTPVGEGTAYIIAISEDGNFSENCFVAVSPEDIEYYGTDIAASGGSYAINIDDTVWSWGSIYNTDGSISKRIVPVKVNNLEGIVQISAGPSHTMALKDDGTIWAWGYNGYGQIGEGSGSNYYTPVKINGMTDIVQVSAGFNHSLALKNDGSVWSWGFNEKGQLGIGSNNNINTPIQVSNLSDIVSISAGNEYSMALKRDGTVWAWGSNDNGKLGIGTSYGTNIPTQVDMLTNIIQISAKYNHSMALKNDGTVWVWGLNNHGQLGDGTFNSTNKPICIDELSDIEQVSVGEYHSMALKSDGTVWAWGYNNSGQIGKLTEYTDINTPIQIDNITDVVQISAGNNHSLALKSNGTVWSWGNNISGQLGNMSTDSSTIPVQSIFGLSIDITAPYITYTSPVSNSVGVPSSDNITLTFNESIKIGDSYNYITLKDSNNNNISIKQKAIDRNTLKIIPQTALKSSTTYILNIPSKSVIDYFNNNFASSYNLSFTTENESSGLSISNGVTIQGINENGQFVWTKEDIDEKKLDFIESGKITTIKNNAFLNRWNDTDPSHWMRFTGSQYSDNKRFLSMNYWGTTSEFLISKAIIDFNDFMNLQEVIYKPFLTEAPETCYPFVTDVYVTNSSGETVTEVGAESIQIHVLFNRDMDETVQPQVNFGPDLPTTDYTVNAVDGGWTTPRHWIGEMTITPITGDGYQFFRVAGAVAADDSWLVTGNDSERFGFEIITSGTEAMNLQATGGENKVELMWTQDDFDLLAGYNLYRSTSMNGEYTKINTTVIPSEQKNYTDTNVLPGQQYFYKFKVVKTDLTESDFSNVASATPNDTIAPVIAHTPVQSAVPGLPLQIYADVTDNVRVETVTLYYRTSNKDNPVEYTTLPMIKTTGNRYSATVGGSSVDVPGLEYYIEASDGTTLKRSGRADLPYLVQVTDAPKITSISPAIGPTSGGTNVVITGTNFKEGATVTFGNAVASNVVVVSSTRITAVTPAHLPAQVDVKVTNANGYSSSLLLGFNYESDGVEVSISDINANVGQIIEVPINIANVSGLIGADMKITYNPELLSFKGARKGNLTSNFWLEGNSNIPGEVNISCSSATPTSGTGSLAIIEFEVLSSEIKTSDIAFESILINDGSINVNVINGKFILSDLYEINGNIYYYNGGYTVNNVNLKLDGNRTYSTTSANYGTYKISGIERGDYKLTASKSDEVTGISSFDASIILQYITGKTSLDANQLIAADVNKNGMITAMDASYILQKAVDLISLPFPGAGEVWTFMPSEKTYVDLQASRTYENFSAILIGDITGNWNEGSGLQSISNTEIFTGDIRTEGLISIVPVGIECNKENIYAVDLTVSYDPTIAKFVSAEGLTAYENLMILTNETVPGTVKIALASDEPMLSGKLLDLKFSLQGTGELNLKVNTADANESQANLLMDGYISNGYITHFIIDRDGVKIVVPLASTTGYAFAYSTQNEFYQYFKGSNNTPIITALLSGTKYMPVGGMNGYAINYSFNETTKEAMQDTPWISKDTYHTYYLFEGFDSTGNPKLTPLQ